MGLPVEGEELASVEIAASDAIHTVCHVTLSPSQPLHCAAVVRGDAEGAAAQGLEGRGSGEGCGSASLCWLDSGAEEHT